MFASIKTYLVFSGAAVLGIAAISLWLYIAHLRSDDALTHSQNALLSQQNAQLTEVNKENVQAIAQQKQSYEQIQTALENANTALAAQRQKSDSNVQAISKAAAMPGNDVPLSPSVQAALAGVAP